MRRGILLIAALAVTVWAAGLVTARRAAAHAEPVEVSPAPGIRLAEPPPAIVVRFDDELDGEASVIELVDEDGEVIARGGLDLEVIDHTTMRLTVPAGLPAGAFAIRWGVASVADGHVVRGESGFAVGPADPRGALVGMTPAADRGDPAGAGGGASVMPWLGAFAGAAAFLVVAVVLGGRRPRRAEKEPEPSSRAP